MATEDARLNAKADAVSMASQTELRAMTALRIYGGALC
jgi:hypothetical protein